MKTKLDRAFSNILKKIDNLWSVPKHTSMKMINGQLQLNLPKDCRITLFLHRQKTLYQVRKSDPSLILCSSQTFKLIKMSSGQFTIWLKMSLFHLPFQNTAIIKTLISHARQDQLLTEQVYHNNRIPLVWLESYARMDSWALMTKICCNSQRKFFKLISQLKPTLK